MGSLYTIILIVGAMVALLLNLLHVWNADNIPEFFLLIAILNELLDGKRGRG